MKGIQALNVVLRTPFLKAAAHAVGSELANGREQLKEQRRRKKAREANKNNPDAIFVWIPKTAGTSLLDQLIQNGAQYLLTVAEIAEEKPDCGICTFGHIAIPQLLEAGLLDKTYFDRSWVFAIVRNPFDRTVSLFEYLRDRGDIPPTTTFSIFCQYLAGGAFEPIGMYNHLHLNQLNPQVSWLTDSSGKLFADFVGHYESLAEDTKTIFEKLKCKAGPLEQLNKSNRRPLRAYYSEKEIETVQSVYKQDFLTFGYNMAPGF